MEEEVSDALTQGSRLDGRGRPGELGGPRGAEAQHLLAPKIPEVLLYHGRVLEGEGGGTRVVVAAVCGVW